LTTCFEKIARFRRRPILRRRPSRATPTSTPKPSVTPKRFGPGSPGSSSGRVRGTASSIGGRRTPKWFVGGRINASVNCLDRHIRGPRRNKAALVWEGEPGERRTLTYAELDRQVCRFANVLKSLGVTKGDRVAIYLPLVPELDRDARLRAHRCGAQRLVRRLQRRIAARSYQ
jgi:hypothetical protein